MPHKLILPVCLCYFVLCFNFSFAQQSSPKLMLPIGNRLEVLSARFSPDGKKIVTASADKTALVWDAATGNLLLDLNDHKDIVSAAEFSPDGKKIVTASYDNMVKIWDAVTGEHLFTLKGHKDSVFTAHFSPDSKKIVSASADGAAKLWDVLTRRLIADLKGHTAQFSSDGKKIVTGFADGQVVIWDAETGIGKYLGGIGDEPHRASITSAQFSRDNKYVVTTSEDNTAKIWDVSNGKLLKTMRGHKSILNAAQFSSDGTKVVTASNDRTAIIWKTFDAKDKDTLVLRGHRDWVISAQFSPDGKKIFTNSADKTVRIWDAATGHPDTVLRGHSRRVNSAAFSPDSTKVITASYDGTVKMWDVKADSLITTLKGHTYWAYSARFSPDGKKIVTATDDSTPKIWDAVTGNLLTNLKGHNNWVISAQFSPDGKKIITTSKDKTAKVWDAGTGNMDINFRPKNNAYSFLFADFSMDSKKFALVTSKDSLKIMDAFTGDPVSAPIGHPGVVSAEFSPDGQKIITASADSTAKVWGVANGNFMFSLKGHTDKLLYAEFSPDGTKIVTSSYDRTAGIWDAVNGHLDTFLVGHKGPVTEAHFSRDSKKIITASLDNTSRLWDVNSGKLLATLKGHTDCVNSAQFDSSGKKIITASGDNTIKIWNAEKGKLLYTFFAVDSSDYLIVDPSDHFDGSENARNLLYFTCGSEMVSLDQVKEDLWVPNLAESLNAGKTITAKTLDQLDICGLIPEVEATGNNPEELQFKITPHHGGLGETVLFVNGIEAKRYTKEEFKNNNGVYWVNIKKDSLMNYFINNEENQVSLKAYTKDNDIFSPEAKISVKPDRPSAPVSLYAMIVGTSNYIGEDEIDLNYPAIDARAISQIVERAAKNLLDTDGREHVYMYNLTTDQEDSLKKPTKQNIKKTLEEIGKNATANDMLLIFLSGHGETDEEGEKKQFYYMTADASLNSMTNSPSTVGIGTAELTDWINPKNIRAQKRILILDACNSGQAINDLLANRSQMIKDIDRLNERAGLFILSASASNKSAFESDKYSHGYLTYALLKAVKEQPDILVSGKYLNISRWFNTAGEMVRDLAKEENKDQKTKIYSVIDFNIGIVDDSVTAHIKLSEEKPLFAGSEFQNADTAADGDDLRLRISIDQALKEISTTGKDSKIVYNQTTASPDAYKLSGKYEVKDNNVNVKVTIKKGNDSKYKFEENGTKDKPKVLADSIVAKVTEWVAANKNK